MTIKGICRPLRSILIAKGEQEDNNWISAEILQDYPPLGVFFFFLSPAHSSFCVASLAWRGLLFMSAYYWVDKMDHLVSSLILSPSFFFFCWIVSGQEALCGNLPCDIWLPALRHKVKKGGEERRGRRRPCARLMEMQKTSSASHSIHHHHHHHRDLFSESPDGVSGFEGAPQQQVEASEHGTFPRRSKQQNPKFAMSRKIFPWMKESRHSNQKPGRRVAGLYDINQQQQRILNEAVSTHFPFNVAPNVAYIPCSSALKLQSGMRGEGPGSGFRMTFVLRIKQTKQYNLISHVMFIT